MTNRASLAISEAVVRTFTEQRRSRGMRGLSMSARREVALSCRGEFARGSPVDATGPIRRTTSKRTSNNQVVGKSLGQLIGELREEAGISRSALAKAAKLSPPEVSRIEL